MANPAFPVPSGWQEPKDTKDWRVPAGTRVSAESPEYKAPLAGLGGPVAWDATECMVSSDLLDHRVLRASLVRRVSRAIQVCTAVRAQRALPDIVVSMALLVPLEQVAIGAWMAQLEVLGRRVGRAP